MDLNKEIEIIHNRLDSIESCNTYHLNNQIVEKFVSSGKWLVVSNTIHYITKICQDDSIECQDKIERIRETIEEMDKNKNQYVATENNLHQFLSKFNDLKIASCYLHRRVSEQIGDIEEQLSIDVEEMV